MPCVCSNPAVQAGARVLTNFLMQDALKVPPVRRERCGFGVRVVDHLLQGPTNAFDLGPMTRPPHQTPPHRQDQDRGYHGGTHRKAVAPCKTRHFQKRSLPTRQHRQSLQMPPDILAKGLGRGIAPGRVLAKRLEDDLVGVARQLTAQPFRRSGAPD